jgi:hypothetical protein
MKREVSCFEGKRNWLHVEQENKTGEDVNAVIKGVKRVWRVGVGGVLGESNLNCVLNVRNVLVICLYVYIYFFINEYIIQYLDK